MKDASYTSLIRAFKISGQVSLIPYLAASILLIPGVAEPGFRQQAISGLQSFGALHLAFLAGGAWMIIIIANGPSFRLGYWTPIALLALSLVAVFLPPKTGFALLAAGHAASGALDQHAVHAGHLPRWYGKWRLSAAFIAIACLVWGLAASNPL